MSRLKQNERNRTYNRLEWWVYGRSCLWAHTRRLRWLQRDRWRAQPCEFGRSTPSWCLPSWALSAASLPSYWQSTVWMTKLRRCRITLTQIKWRRPLWMSSAWSTGRIRLPVHGTALKRISQKHLQIEITMKMQMCCLRNPSDSNSSGNTHTMLYLSIKYFR